MNCTILRMTEDLEAVLVVDIMDITTEERFQVQWTGIDGSRALPADDNLTRTSEWWSISVGKNRYNKSLTSDIGNLKYFVKIGLLVYILLAELDKNKFTLCNSL